MKLTKKEISYFRDLLFDLEEVGRFSKNIRKIKIYNKNGERITHKEFIKLERRVSFLMCALGAFRYGESVRISKNGEFYFKRVL